MTPPLFFYPVCYTRGMQDPSFHAQDLEHAERHAGSGAMIRDIIIGMSDGLTVPFALAAGLSGAVDSTGIIMTAGLAEIAAGSISMGLGGYLAAKNDSEHYDHELAREYDEVVTLPHKERQEVIDIFKEYGLTDVDVAPILKHFAEDHDAWVAFMMKHELGLDKPDEAHASRSAITIAVSYMVGGAVPLAPYFFVPQPHTALLVSAGFTAVALALFGWAKSRYNGTNPWSGALRTMIIGGIAAGVAYGLAKLIS